MDAICVSDPLGLWRPQVGETSVVNVDCSRAGPGQLSLEAVPDSSPASPTGSAPAAGKPLSPAVVLHATLR